MSQTENKPVSGKMRAANLHAVGDMRCELLDIPTCGEDEVLVKIKCCGICGSDVPRALKKGTYRFPTVIGHEFSGEVVYDKSGKHFGKRVAVFPLLPCFSCENCKTEDYAQCLNYDYYGSRRDGGLAEYVAVKTFNLIELPEGVSYEEGAMCEPVSVADHATRKLGDVTGQTLLITGAGPIGLIAGMWAKGRGASKILYLDIDEGKLAFAESLGFERYNGTETVDAAIEGTGASVPLAKIVSALHAGGKAVLMGNPAGAVSLDDKTYQTVLRKELVLLGTWNSSYAEKQNDWRESLDAMAKGEISLLPLITHKVSLENCFNALKMMQERTEFYCKVMVNNEA